MSAKRAEMTKRFALVFDVSPSEQIVDGLNDIKTLGFVIGLRSPKSIEEVGKEFPDAGKRLSLKKWAGSSPYYRKNFIAHMTSVVAARSVLCGWGQANDAEILGVGGKVFQNCFGKFPDKVEINKRGKPKIKLGGYDQDGQMFSPFVIPVFDLCVIGWMSEMILTLCLLIKNAHEAICNFDVIIDRFPNDQHDYQKVKLLRTIVHKMSEGRVEVIGVPDPALVVQRDLFVDNVAGLAHYVVKNPDSNLAKLVQQSENLLFSITRPASNEWFERLNAALSKK